jgi:hypothetical protein
MPALTDAQYDAKIAAQAKALADAQALLKTPWAQPDAKVGNTKLTQAQTDAAAAAKATAAEITADFPGFTSKVNPTTGMVETKSPTGATVGTPVGETPEQKAAREAKAAADKAAAEAQAIADAKAAKDKLDAEQAAAALAAKEQNLKADAFALITDTMSTYGFNADELAQITTFIQDALVNPKMGTNQTILALRNLPAYKSRFAGNGQRVANGLNALSEANYIQQEDAMNQYLTSHGVANLGTRSVLANLIGNGIAATDVNIRAALAVDQVKNADPQILKQLQTYYPDISKGDMVSYFLDPANTLPQLQQKVTTGQIGAAFQEQKLDSSLANMADLTAYGVTQSQAIAGAGNIASVLPTTTKLGDIYNETGIKYDQTAGQAEFLKSDAAAQLKRKQLAQLETNQFRGDAGTSQQFSSIGKSVQGAF